MRLAVTALLVALGLATFTQQYAQVSPFRQTNFKNRFSKAVKSHIAVLHTGHIPALMITRNEKS